MLQIKHHRSRRLSKSLIGIYPSVNMAEAAPTLDLESEYPPLDPVSDSLMDNVTDDAQLKMSIKILKEESLLYPKEGQRVDIVYSSFREDYSPIESKQNYSFVLGHDHAIKALDLVVERMREGEVAVVKSSAEYAFGILGCGTQYAPNCDLFFEITLLRHYNFDHRVDIDIDKRLRYAQGLLQRGNHLFALSNYKRAIEIYATGIIYLYDHDTKYCAARILRSIEDLHIKLYLPMMLCYHRIGNVKRCQKAAEKVLSIDGLNPKALFLKGRCMACQGEKRGGLEYMEKALRLRPSDQEIKEAVEELKVEILIQAVEGKSKKRSRRKGKKGRRSIATFDEDRKTEAEDETEYGVTSSNGETFTQESLAAGEKEMEEITKKVMDEAINQVVKTVECEKKREEMANIKHTVGDITEEMIDEVLIIAEEKEAELAAAKKIVDGVMEKIKNDAVIFSEEKDREAETFTIKNNIHEFMEEVIDLIVSSDSEGKENDKEIASRQSVHKFLEDTIDQIVLKDEEKKQELENLAIEKRVNKFLEMVLHHPVFSDKKESNAETLAVKQCIERLMDEIKEENQTKHTIKEMFKEMIDQVITTIEKQVDAVDRIVTTQDIVQVPDSIRKKSFSETGALKKDFGNHSGETIEKDALGSETWETKSENILHVQDVCCSLEEVHEPEYSNPHGDKEKITSRPSGFRWKGLRKRIRRLFRRFRRR